jgi:hypothetical protein
MSKELISKATRNEFREVLTLCELLLESDEYQKEREERQAS